MIIVLNRAVRFTLAAELHTQDNTSNILNINTYALITHLANKSTRELNFRNITTAV